MSTFLRLNKIAKVDMNVLNVEVYDTMYKAAFNEKMQLAGTVPGGSFSLDGKTFNYGVLIPPSEINICLEEWSQS